MPGRIVLIYSLIHFVVDFACVALVTALSAKHHAPLFTAIVSYNFFAFFMQLPLGIIADKLNKNALVSALGCALVAGAFAWQPWPFVACVIAGVGNALFHLGGGIDVLNISRKRAAPSGIFVSTGALGLFFGISMAGHVPYVVGLLLLSMSTLVALYTRIRGKISNLPMCLPPLSFGKLWVIIGLTVTVFLRSYAGCLTAFGWKSAYLLALAAVCGVVLGKMLGGIIGDRAGFVPTAGISLLIASGSFLVSFEHPLAGCIALVCFNMTMPLTLTALANLLPHNKGFAFGMLTAALFAGALPAFWGVRWLASGAGLCLLSLLSAVLLLPALYYGGKYAA